MAIPAYHHEPSPSPNDSIVADLERAQRALRDDPDLAALYLDGALRELLALAACPGGVYPPQPRAALYDLERSRPLLAQRIRLALRAPNVEARLVHCWSLLDLLSRDAALDASGVHALKG